MEDEYKWYKNHFLFLTQSKRELERKIWLFEEM